MVHELFFIHNNTVKLKKRTSKGIEIEQVNAWKYFLMIDKPKLLQIVLSEASDPFFAQHSSDNFGDLGEAVKSMLIFPCEIGLFCLQICWSLIRG